MTAVDHLNHGSSFINSYSYLYILLIYLNIYILLQQVLMHFYFLKKAKTQKAAKTPKSKDTFFTKCDSFVSLLFLGSCIFNN